MRHFSISVLIVLLEWQALAQTFREVKLELQVVQQLRHPSIVSFMGSAVRFPGDRHEDPNDWTVGLIFGQLHRWALVEGLLPSSSMAARMHLLCHFF